MKLNSDHLFKLQDKLDNHIYNEHPELKGQNNLDWKILALQVELGECANEWRGFKKWSNNQKPRTEVKYLCPICDGSGDENHDIYVDGLECRDDHEFIECKQCGGTGELGYSNPLLEEYVDGLHFFLSIGLEEVEKDNHWGGYQLKNELTLPCGFHESNIINQFNALFFQVGLLADLVGGKLFEDVSNIPEAYSNAFGLFVGLGEKLGFTWEQIEQAYLQKNEVNHQRQESGY